MFLDQCQRNQYLLHNIIHNLPMLRKSLGLSKASLDGIIPRALQDICKALVALLTVIAYLDPTIFEISDSKVDTMGP